jgi:hypothetical protein
MQHNKDDLIIFTKGHYSDYHLEKTCRALVDFDEVKVYNDFLATGAKHVTGNTITNQYLDYYIQQGLVEVVPHKEIHLGDYYDLEQPK